MIIDAIKELASSESVKIDLYYKILPFSLTGRGLPWVFS